MTRRRHAALLSVCCCIPLVAGACGDDESSSEPIEQPQAESTVTENSPPEATMPAIDRPSTPEPPTTPTPPASAPPITPSSPSTSSNLEIAKADLRTRVGADVAIEVVSHEEVTWPNGGLGCPDPDMSYTQALVNGERIVLRAAGTVYEYHSGASRPAFYCPASRVTPPVTGSYGDA